MTFNFEEVEEKRGRPKTRRRCNGKRSKKDFMDDPIDKEKR